jgi:serine palmitoyltransferase
MSTSTGPSGTGDISPILLPIVGLLSSTLTWLTAALHRVPGSPIFLRYIKSSYQDDPWRSLLEVLLVAFALRTLLSRQTRGEGEGKGLKLSEKVSSLARGEISWRSRGKRKDETYLAWLAYCLVVFLAEI